MNSSIKDKCMTSQSISWSPHQQPLALNKSMRPLPQKKWRASEMRLIPKLANHINDKICAEDGTMCPFFRVHTTDPIRCFQTRGESSTQMGRGMHWNEPEYTKSVFPKNFINICGAQLNLECNKDSDLKFTQLTGASPRCVPSSLQLRPWQSPSWRLRPRAPFEGGTSSCVDKYIEYMFIHMRVSINGEPP